MMGATEEVVRMPKPSRALTASEKPTPMASTKGTAAQPARAGAGSGAEACGNELLGLCSAFVSGWTV